MSVGANPDFEFDRITIASGHVLPGQSTFLRRFGLLFETEAEKARANLDQGLLKVFVPRLASGEKKPTTIPVSVKP